MIRRMTYMWTVAVLLAVAIVSSGCATMNMKGLAAMRAGIQTGFINKVALIDGKPSYYVLYVPRDYDPGKAWPLVVFLHGMGERGKDGMLQTEVGIGRAIRRHADRFPCLVAMPQCPASGYWDKGVKPIEKSIKQTIGEYNVDRERIALTGISMGGYATWYYGAAHPELFSALMPICGGGRVEDAPALAKLPIWAFHGAEDNVVPPDESRHMVDAIKAAGGKIKYTEYPGTEHNSWDSAYDDAKAIRWLLRQRRNTPPAMDDTFDESDAAGSQNEILRNAEQMMSGTGQ